MNGLKAVMCHRVETFFGGGGESDAGLGFVLPALRVCLFPECSDCLFVNNASIIKAVSLVAHLKTVSQSRQALGGLWPQWLKLCRMQAGSCPEEEVAWMETHFHSLPQR